VFGWLACYFLITAAFGNSSSKGSSKFEKDTESDRIESGTGNETGKEATAPSILQSVEFIGSVSVKRLRIAAVFMAIRAFFDTADGVLARAHIEEGFTYTKWVDGATWDVVTDMSSSGLWFFCLFAHFLCRKVDTSGYALSPLRTADQGYRRTLAVRLRSWMKFMTSPSFVARAVPFFALLMAVTRSLLWEYYIRRFGELVDHTRDPAMLKYADGWICTMVFFYWATACGDACLSYTTIACWTNSLWTCARWMILWGLLWSAVVIIWTEVVYRYLVQLAVGAV